eukprot:TRINITY_DN1633_c0_g6_i1.p1 TRINITY_DN1633_c0_g6~~TRINITY_DN1633_c0_g6_i1.p1  ORF type:complete len:301 (+),score=106.64 TRINITY_DN1633_c0_g6_i1:50-904(+)
MPLPAGWCELALPMPSEGPSAVARSVVEELSLLKGVLPCSQAQLAEWREAAGGAAAQQRLRKAERMHERVSALAEAASRGAAGGEVLLALSFGSSWKRGRQHVLVLFSPTPSPAPPPAAQRTSLRCLWRDLVVASSDPALSWLLSAAGRAAQLHAAAARAAAGEPGAGWVRRDGERVALTGREPVLLLRVGGPSDGPTIRDFVLRERQLFQVSQQLQSVLEGRCQSRRRPVQGGILSPDQRLLPAREDGDAAAQRGADTPAPQTASPIVHADAVFGAWDVAVAP